MACALTREELAPATGHGAGDEAAPEDATGEELAAATGHGAGGSHRRGARARSTPWTHAQRKGGAAPEREGSGVGGRIWEEGAEQCVRADLGGGRGAEGRDDGG